MSIAVHSLAINFKKLLFNVKIVDHVEFVFFNMLFVKHVNRKNSLFFYSIDLLIYYCLKEIEKVKFLCC